MQEYRKVTVDGYDMHDTVQNKTDMHVPMESPKEFPQSSLVGVPTSYHFSVEFPAEFP